MNFLSEEKRAKLSEVLFYVALTIELGIMLLDKSELYLRNFSTYVFYVTFAISVTVVLLMKHDKKRVDSFRRDICLFFYMLEDHKAK